MSDMTNLDYLRDHCRHAPGARDTFRAFDMVAFAEGALSVRHKQLIAVAVVP